MRKGLGMAAVIGSRCRGLFLVVGFAGALALTGCRQLAVDGRAELAHQDGKGGQRVGDAEAVARQMGVVADAEKTAYLNVVGKRLTEQIPDRQLPCNIAILDQATPNAFALADGHIFVSRGLLALANSEDEIAGVLAHEIVHYWRRHHVKSAQRRRLPRLLSLPGRAVSGVINDDLGALLNLPVNMLGGAFLASYGRHHEFESDKFGVQLAAAAGYDPAGLPTMLARMEKEGQLSGHSAGVPSFLNTHPLTPRRLWRCRAQAGKVVRKDIPPIAKGRTEFLQKMAGLLVGESPGLGVFTGGRFLHPDLGFVIEFPEGWRTVNTRAAAGAVSPQKDACIFLGVAGRGAQPKQRAEALAQKMAAAHGLRPDRSEAVTVGPYTGHLLTFSDTTAGDPASMYFLWFGRDDLVFQVIGLATPARLDTLKKTVRSFRSPTPAERDAIQARYLHTAVLRPGEDLERLSKRTGNAWSSAMTHLANGVETGTALQTGSPVKVSVARRYSSLEER